MGEAAEVELINRVERDMSNRLFEHSSDGALHGAAEVESIRELLNSVLQRLETVETSIMPLVEEARRAAEDAERAAEDAERAAREAEAAGTGAGEGTGEGEGEGEGDGAGEGEGAGDEGGGDSAPERTGFMDRKVFG